MMMDRDRESQAADDLPPDEIEIELESDRAGAPEGETPGDEDEAVPTLEEQVADLEDRLLRTAAEFENYRKRLNRERDEWLRYRHEPLVREILPVLDSLERAIRSSEGTRDYQAFHDGAELILQQLRDVLQRAGVERDDPAGEVFDPHRHEAVATIPDEAVPADHVAEVIEPGYQLFERVVRPAKVVVSLGGSENADSEPSGVENAG
jgi:molecular chaperone GrpE